MIPNHYEFYRNSRKQPFCDPELYEGWTLGAIPEDALPEMARLFEFGIEHDLHHLAFFEQLCPDPLKAFLLDYFGHTFITGPSAGGIYKESLLDKLIEVKPTGEETSTVDEFEQFFNGLQVCLNFNYIRALPSLNTSDQIFKWSRGLRSAIVEASRRYDQERRADPSKPLFDDNVKEGFPSEREWLISTFELPWMYMLSRLIGNAEDFSDLVKECFFTNYPTDDDIKMIGLIEEVGYVFVENVIKQTTQAPAFGSHIPYATFSLAINGEGGTLEGFYRQMAADINEAIRQGEDPYEWIQKPQNAALYSSNLENWVLDDAKRMSHLFLPLVRNKLDINTEHEESAQWLVDLCDAVVKLRSEKMEQLSNAIKERIHDTEGTDTHVFDSETFSHPHVFRDDAGDALRAGGAIFENSATEHRTDGHEPPFKSNFRPMNGNTLVRIGNAEDRVTGEGFTELEPTMAVVEVAAPDSYLERGDIVFARSAMFLFLRPFDRNYAIINETDILGYIQADEVVASDDIEHPELHDIGNNGHSEGSGIKMGDLSLNNGNPFGEPF